MNVFAGASVPRRPPPDRKEALKAAAQPFACGLASSQAKPERDHRILVVVDERVRRRECAEKAAARSEGSPEARRAALRLRSGLQPSQARARSSHPGCC